MALLTQFSADDLVSKRIKRKLKRHTARHFKRSHIPRHITSKSLVDVEGLILCETGHGLSVELVRVKDTLDRVTYHFIAALAFSIEAGVLDDEGTTTVDGSTRSFDGLGFPSKVLRGNASSLDGAHHGEERKDNSGEAGEHIVGRLQTMKLCEFSFPLYEKAA